MTSSISARFLSFITGRGLVVLLAFYSIFITTFSIWVLAFVLGVDRLYWPSLVIQILGISATLFTITLTVAPESDRETNSAFAFANAIAVLPGLTSAIIGPLISSGETSKITESVIFDILSKTTHNPQAWSLVVCVLLLLSSWAIAVLSARQLSGGDTVSIDLTVPSVFILSVQIVILDQWSGTDVETSFLRAVLGLLWFAAAMWIASLLFVRFLRKAREGFVRAAASVNFSINAVASFLVAFVKTAIVLTVHTAGFLILIATVLLIAAESSNSVSELLAEFLVFVSVAMIGPFAGSIFYLIGFAVAVQPALAVLKVVWVSVRQSSLFSRAGGLLQRALLGMLFLTIVAIAFGVIFLLLLWLRWLLVPNDKDAPPQAPPIEDVVPVDPESGADREILEGVVVATDEEAAPPLQRLQVSALEISCEGGYAPLNWVNGSSLEVSSSLFRCNFDSSSISNATRAVVAVGMASPGRSKEREIDRARRRTTTLTRWLNIESEEIHLLGLNLGMRVTDDAASVASGFGSRGERPIVIWTIDAVPTNADATRADVIGALESHLSSTKIADAYSSCELFEVVDFRTNESIEWACGADLESQD